MLIKVEITFIISKCDNNYEPHTHIALSPLKPAFLHFHNPHFASRTSTSQKTTLPHALILALPHACISTLLPPPFFTPHFRVRQNDTPTCPTHMHNCTPATRSPYIYIAHTIYINMDKFFYI
jgi:hypothetical protein